MTTEIKKYRYASTHPLSDGQMHEYVRAEDYERLSAELEKVRAESQEVMNMLILCGEHECVGLSGAVKLRALIDALIEQRQRADSAESKNIQLVAQVARMEEAATNLCDLLLDSASPIGPFYSRRDYPPELAAMLKEREKP